MAAAAAAGRPEEKSGSVAEMRIIKDDAMRRELALERLGPSAAPQQRLTKGA